MRTSCLTESSSQAAAVVTDAEIRRPGEDDADALHALISAEPAELLRSLAALPPRHPSRPALRATVIEAWLPFAQHLANRLSGRGVPLDDLHQVAALG